ncbi:MAG: deoxyribose-phosphate aldolase [Acidobacteria bacterium]|nr:deoxyribose-phosphate aldolase [Acidobacteriota bacterium]
MPVPKPSDLAAYIDHTLLKPDCRQAEVERLCAEAVTHHFAAVCVLPCWLRLAAQKTAVSAVAAGTVIGFPLGAAVSGVKAQEARQAIADGATELDMVLNISALKSGQDDWVALDIRGVVEVARPAGALVKVILETCLLTDEEKNRACRIAEAAGADFVKTSTGFSYGGATVEDVRLMRAAVGSTVQVKASGGIRTFAQAVAMLQAGATRLGTSSGVALVTG